MLHRGAIGPPVALDRRQQVPGRDLELLAACRRLAEDVHRGEVDHALDRRGGHALAPADDVLEIDVFGHGTVC